MDKNPYESPLSETNGYIARAAMSRMRLPLDIVCGLISLLFVATIFTWGMKLGKAGFNAPAGRLAVVYIFLSVFGILAFGLIAFGFLRRRVRPVKVELLLFAIGAIVRVIAAMVPL